MTILRIVRKIMIDRIFVLVLSCMCCVSCDMEGAIALRANILKNLIDISELTIGDALLLKHILGLSDAEATAIFLGGVNREDIPA